jgi:IclR family acetate operon transcriptional repressor
VLEELNMETSESVNLSVRSGAESVVMMRVQSTLPLRFEQRPGARFPLYATASGKAILAMSPHVEMYLKTLPRQLSKVTQYTLETPDELARELQETRERGYSIDEQENVEGVGCVGAPVLDRDGSAQAALVIQVPSVRLPKSRVRSLGGRLVQAAAEAAQFIPVNRAMSR